MKKNFKYQMAGRGLSAALLLLGLSASAQPFSNPSGTVWDCTMSGPRDGLAVLAFDDKTFTMNEIIVPKKAVTTVESRGTVTDSRTGITTDTKFTSTNLFGGGPVTGPWNFDAQGHIIGFFIETDGETTNQFSFVGTMVANKRLTLKVGSTVGNIVYRGMPLVSLTNYSGDYYGILSQSQRKYLDLFTLSNPGAGPWSVVPGDNIYSLSGSGPGYSYDTVAFAMISGWKKIAYLAKFNEDTNMLRAVVGSFSLKTATGNTSGMEQHPGDVTNRVSFKTYMIQSVGN